MPSLTGPALILAVCVAAKLLRVGALMLAWLSTGANCLLEVTEQGKTAQMVDLGTSILPPNAANLLVTKDGGVIASLGSPGRLVRLESGAAAAAA